MKAPSGCDWVKLSDIPRPHRFFFKGTKRKRDVEVKLFICPGYTHVYADLEEADDVVWDPRDKQWKLPEKEWDDPEMDATSNGMKFKADVASGKRYHERFEKRVEAEQWVLNEAKKNFPARTHRLVSSHYPHPIWKPKHLGKDPRECLTKCAKCRLPISERGTNISGDWTGSPYCDICIRHAPDYGDYDAKAVWDKVTPAQARKWTKV